MKKDINYYLSKGMDQKTAEYFASGRKKIIAVAANDDFTLTLTFDNAEKRLYDMREAINAGGVFKHIAAISDFKRVYLDDCGCVAWDIDPNIDSKKVWNNKIDLCADSCYIDSTPVSEEHTA